MVRTSLGMFLAGVMQRAMRPPLPDERPIRRPGLLIAASRRSTISNSRMRPSGPASRACSDGWSMSSPASACTGFTTNFRLVTQIDTGEQTRVSDQQTKTFEDVSDAASFTSRPSRLPTTSWTRRSPATRRPGERRQSRPDRPDGRRSTLPASRSRPITCLK